MKIIWCWDSGFHQCSFTMIHIIRNVRITHTHSIEETILAIHLCALSVCRSFHPFSLPYTSHNIKFYAAAAVVVVVIVFSWTNFSLIALSSMTKRNNESRDNQRRRANKSEQEQEIKRKRDAEKSVGVEDRSEMFVIDIISCDFSRQFDRAHVSKSLNYCSCK